MSKRRPEHEDGVITETQSEQKLDKPRMYRVLLHNDNYTTMEFVVFVLVTVFHKDETQAVQVMLNVHNKGVGVAGIYSREVAETKMETVVSMARDAEFPLQCSMEPE
jgi:ATP-dependent Clp protease adaptor protein ClpS